MTGQFYLGNDVDAAFCRIAHHFAQLFLRIVASVRCVVEESCVATDDGMASLGTNLVQSRIFLALNAPSLIVGEMPVEGVHVVQGENVDILLHLFHRKEMAAHVEMHGAVGKARRVVDHCCR